MVKNSIKIYARLKQENQAKLTTYEIFKTEKNETITFRFGYVGSFINSKPQIHRFRKYFDTKSSDHYLKNYRFEKVFDQQSTQIELFDTIAKPVVNSVIEGFNGTIFAYGQTGSGKTYAITGSAKDYQERGIIPRSIEEIFEFINKAPDKYTVYISYLEIYNEVGYDLLNPKSQISHLEELPFADVTKYQLTENYYQILRSRLRKVILLEDGKGESHIRNLTVQRVSSEQEAMRLLFLGDTNRTITETPMNVYSSRSHCIFTIFINSRSTSSGKIRRSKLNLVDLAGSERICKSNISGTTLNEAKYINLSLHYLEQVILALSQKKSHIPFRNSMLTYVLKDSLSGNCKTVLLSTLNVNKKNIEETIATCKFAQRVAEVNMEAMINDEIDPQQEIDCLKTEIESLRRQLLQQSKFKMSGNLTKEEKQQWKNVVNNYLNDSKEEIPLKNFDMRLIKYSFKLLKDAVKSREEQQVMLKSTETGNEELIQKYKDVIKQKEEEISTLKKLLCSNVKLQPACSNSFSYSEDSTNSFFQEQEKENIPPSVDSFALSPGQKIAFEVFMKDSKNTSELDYYTQAIQDMYEIAKKLTGVVEQCQSNILAVRSQHRPDSNQAISEDIDLELQNQQSIYKNSLQKLHELKKKTETLTSGLENAKMKVFNRFKQWYDNISGSDNTLENSKNKTYTKNDNISTLINRPGSNNCKTRTSNPSTCEKELFQNSNNPCLKKEDIISRSKSTFNYSISKLQNRQDDNNSCNRSTRSATDEEGNDSSDCKSEYKPKSPSRIPRLNRKHKHGSKESTDQLCIQVKHVLEEHIRSKSKSLCSSTNCNFKNQKVKSDSSSFDKCTKNDSREEETGNEQKDTCNNARNISITPPNSETNKSEDFCTKNIDNPYCHSKIVSFYQENSTSLLTPFNSAHYKVKELPKKHDDNFCSTSKDCCLQEEKHQNLPIDFRTYIGRARSPHRLTHYNCELPCKSNEKNNPLRAETDNSFDNHRKSQLQSVFRGPQKPEHLKPNSSFEYSIRSHSPRTALSDNRNINTVYQIIMGYDKSLNNNPNQISKRPFSAESQIKNFAGSRRDYPKHRIGVSHVNSKSPVRLSNTHCNSRYTNYYIEDPAKFPKIPENSSDDNVEEQEAEESLWEENSTFIERKPRTSYQGLNSQNIANILGLRRSISPQRGSQINEKGLNFATALNQRKDDYRSRYTINNNHAHSPGSIHRVLATEDTKNYKKNCNSNLFSREDSLEFRNFIGTIPLTGDSDVDEEIVKFYRTKFV